MLNDLRRNGATISPKNNALYTIHILGTKIANKIVSGGNTTHRVTQIKRIKFSH